MPGFVEVLEAKTLLSGFSALYTVAQDWGSGLEAEITIENTSGDAIKGWSLAFDFPGRIDSLWNGTITSSEGGRYVVANPSWNDTIPSGGSVSFGFVASPGGTGSPSHYSLNGQSMDEGGTPPSVLPRISVNDISVREDAGEARFVVTLDAPASELVRVDYGTVDGSATAGADYVAKAGTLSFAPGVVSKEVAVTILDDDLVEGDETFRLILSGPVGAALARAEAVATIIDDDAPPMIGDLSVSYRVTQDWGSGFQGELTLSNGGTTPVTDWSFSFNFEGTINSLWDGTIVSQEGNRFTISHAGWNATIAAGGEAKIGFTASPGGGAVAPYAFSIGHAGGGGGSDPIGENRPPVAGDDSAVVVSGRSVRIHVLANDSDPDGDPLGIVSVSPPAHGTALPNADGTILYTPWAGYVGSDSFSYVVSDGRGGEAEASVTISVIEAVAAQWPAQSFAPYVDMTLWPTYDLAKTAREVGVNHFALSFIVADPQGRPSWGGYGEYAVNGSAFDLALRAQVDEVRTLGGDVIVSFGGASNRELAEVITDVNALKDAYRSVVDAYGLTAIDMDIEGAGLADRAAVDRRSIALANLQQELAAEGRSLDVWLTLPALPTGLTPDGISNVQSALSHGMDLTGVNVMTMNYGSSAAPNPDGLTGDYAIMAAQSLHSQLKTLYEPGLTDAELWMRVGMTPMIGRNDVVTEVFDQQEAREVVAFAKEVGVGRLAFWSLHRDRSNPNGAISYVEPTSSSIVQDPYEFSRIFLDFLG